MARKVVEDSSKTRELDAIARDLGFEYVYGGDRFDREDIDISLYRAGAEKADLDFVRSRSVDHAVELQRRPDLRDFFFKQAVYWCDFEAYEKCRAWLEYVPSPMDVSDVTLSSREKDVVVSLAQQLQEDWYVDCQMGCVINEGDYKSMLFHALPCLNDSLKLRAGTLVNRQDGYELDGRNIETFSHMDKVTIGIQALNVRGGKYEFTDSPYNRVRSEVSDVDMSILVDDVTEQFKAVKKLLSLKDLSKEQVSRAAAVNLHEIGAKRCFPEEMQLKSGHRKSCPWDQLDEKAMKFREEVSGKVVDACLQLRQELAKEKKAGMRNKL